MVRNHGEISIIIRTCNRPTLLMQALESVRQQTISNNIEIVIVEDGPSKSKFVIDKFSDLNIKYFATDQSVGRTRVGNIGLLKSTGRFLNFLDDDDVLLPDHIETMLNGFFENPTVDAVHTGAIERTIQYLSLDPLRYKIVREYKKYNRPITAGAIFYKNMFPIQSVMFKRELYEKCGGMDEGLELLEDWDLWIRYSMEGTFHYVDKYTSVYHISADRKVLQSRMNELVKQEEVLKNKYRDDMKKYSYSEEGVFTRFINHLKVNGVNNTIKKIIDKIRNSF